MRRYHVSLACFGCISAATIFTAAAWAWQPVITSPIEITRQAPIAIPPKSTKPLENGGPLDQPEANPIAEYRIQGLPPLVAVMGAELRDKSKVLLRLKIVQTRVEEREQTTLKGNYTYLHVTNTEHEVTTEADYDAPSALRGTEIYDLQGKLVDPLKMLGKLNKGGTPVLVSYTGLVDPRYLGVVKEGTLIIVLGTRDRSEGTVRKLFHEKR